MGELIIQILDRLTGPEFVAALSGFFLAVAAILRALGEVFIQIGQIGKFKDEEDWFDSAGAFFRNLALGFGKILAWFGIGNKK